MICELFDFEREMDGFLFWRETKLLKGELTYQSFSLMVIQFSPQFGFVDNKFWREQFDYAKAKFDFWLTAQNEVLNLGRHWTLCLSDDCRLPLYELGNKWQTWGFGSKWAHGLFWILKIARHVLQRVVTWCEKEISKSALARPFFMSPNEGVVFIESGSRSGAYSPRRCGAWRMGLALISLAARDLMQGLCSDFSWCKGPDSFFYLVHRLSSISIGAGTKTLTSPGTELKFGSLFFGTKGRPWSFLTQGPCSILLWCKGQIPCHILLESFFPFSLFPNFLGFFLPFVFLYVKVC